MSLYWSVGLLILKMYCSCMGEKWRFTDHEYVLLWVSTDQCTFTIRISTDQDWAVKRRSTDQYSLSNEDLLIMNNIYLNVYWYLFFSAVQCIDPKSLIFEFLLVMNLCSNEYVLTMTTTNNNDRRQLTRNSYTINDITTNFQQESTT